MQVKLQMLLLRWRKISMFSIEVLCKLCNTSDRKVEDIIKFKEEVK